MIQTGPKFGQKIWIDHKLVRRFKVIPGDCRFVDKKFWEPLKTKRQRVVFLGTRTLSDGHRHWGEGEGCRFEPQQYFKAWLVCAAGKNPFYVFPEKPVGKRLIEIFKT